MDSEFSHYSIKLTIVGPSGSGKTALLSAYTSSVFVHEHRPTVFDNYTVSLRANNKLIRLNLWDTAGSDTYDRLRPLSYINTDVLLCVFALDDLASAEDVERIWLPEMRFHLPHTPIILVGTKLDLVPAAVEESGVPPVDFDCFESLPDELLFQIFSYLPAEEVDNVCLVNSRFHAIATDPLLRECVSSKTARGRVRSFATFVCP